MVRIHLSDGSFFELHAEVRARSGLGVGSSVDEEARRRLVARSDRVRARIQALKLLSRSAHTRRGLARKLEARGFPRPAVRYAVARMVELGYCDDAAFAESWVRLRLAGGRAGATLLYRGLMQRGVPRSVASEAVRRMYPHETEVRNARRLVRNLSRQKAIHRLVGRGFRSRAISEVIRGIRQTGPEPEAD